MTLSHRHATLHLDAAPRVEVEGRTVAVPRKGVALLCYLASEGPTRRHRLADLLWDRTGAMKNLRVEIHRVRTPLRRLGIEPFGGSADPLTLSPQIRIARRAMRRGEELMAGLEDVASGFQAWLDAQRAREAHRADRELRSDLLDDLAKTVAPPFVVVLQGRPGAETPAVARRLARRLELPFFEDVDAARTGVHFVRADRHDAGVATRSICADDRSVWIVERSRFGEDSKLLLHLRAEYPADRLRFVDVPPLTWLEARALLPPNADFDEAARMYLASNGNPRYLTELVALRGERPFGPRLPVPQRMRAAVAVEADRLSRGARCALERLTVAPEPIPPEVVAACGAEEHLDELERSAWLTFEGEGWFFTDRLARSLLFSRLPRGHRARLVEVVRSVLSTGASPHPRTARPRARVGGDATSQVRPPYRALCVGEELWLDEPEEVTPAVAWSGGTVHVVNLNRRANPVLASFDLPSGPLLLRLSGRAFVGRSSHRIAPRSPATLATVTLGGRTRRALRLDDADDASVVVSGHVRVPSRGTFDHWVFVDDATTVSIAGGSQTAVAEIAVRAYRPASEPASGGLVVEAMALDEAAWTDPRPNDTRVTGCEGRLGSATSGERHLEP
jgi:hypothetical protein